MTKTQLKLACKKQSSVLAEVTGRLRHSWNKESSDVRLLSLQLLLGCLHRLSTMPTSCFGITFYRLNILWQRLLLVYPIPSQNPNFILGINVSRTWKLHFWDSIAGRMQFWPKIKVIRWGYRQSFLKGVDSAYILMPFPFASLFLLGTWIWLLELQQLHCDHEVAFGRQATW